MRRRGGRAHLRRRCRVVGAMRTVLVGDVVQLGDGGLQAEVVAAGAAVARDEKRERRKRRCEQRRKHDGHDQRDVAGA